VVQTGQEPWTALFPFLSVTLRAPLICLFALHFTQYASVILSAHLTQELSEERVKPKRLISLSKGLISVDKVQAHAGRLSRPSSHTDLDSIFQIINTVRSWSSWKPVVIIGGRR